MLRSIVAVWLVALALLTIAATAGCGWGCANGDDCSAGLGLDPPMPDLAPLPTCSTACPSCAAGEICHQPAVGARLPAFCARTCADDRDCAAGELCATLADATVPPVCVAAGAPKSCIAGRVCNTVGTWCFDGHTVATPFSHADDGVCGWELVHCANGCTSGACS
jgi:hypothetical protein